MSKQKKNENLRPNEIIVGKKPAPVYVDIGEKILRDQSEVTFKARGKSAMTMVQIATRIQDHGYTIGGTKYYFDKYQKDGQNRTSSAMDVTVKAK